MLAVVGSTGYKIVFMLHILAVIVGFGTVFLNGIYGRAAEQRKGPEALFLIETVEKVGHVAEYVIYTVPLRLVRSANGPSLEQRYGPTLVLPMIKLAEAVQVSPIRSIM